jgi:hypothetical protein
MARPRLLALLLASVAALAVAGCGNKEEEYTFGSTEGVYVSVDELKYQVQISRILNPADVEDQGYLKGISEGVAPAEDEVWFAIFMRVENDGEETRSAADQFEIRDTQGKTFKPLNLDRNANLFAYKPRPVTPGTQIPVINSPASNTSIRGALLLFKVKTDSLYNRPLELHIANSRESQGEAVIDLDV